MNKNEYFFELERCLQKLSVSERKEAVLYYTEYAMDAELLDDDSLVNRLGTPRELASKIYAENAMKTLEQKDGSLLKALGIGLLAFLSLPMTLPILIVAIAMIIAFIVVICSIIFSGGVVIVAFGASTVWLFLRSFGLLLAMDFGGFFQYIGASLAIGGITVISAWIGFKIISWFIRGMVRFFSKKASGGKKI